MYNYAKAWCSQGKRGEIRGHLIITPFCDDYRHSLTRKRVRCNQKQYNLRLFIQFLRRSKTKQLCTIMLNELRF